MFQLIETTSLKNMLILEKKTHTHTQNRKMGAKWNQLSSQKIRNKKIRTIDQNNVIKRV